ncbi:unnamed protein product [Closterium sp. NIES-54]
MRFTDKMGARLFTLCFNTAFTKGLLSLSLSEVDKPTGRLLRACDSSFCMEVLFAQDCCSSPPPSPVAARPRLTQAGSIVEAAVTLSPCEHVPFTPPPTHPPPHTRFPPPPPPPPPPPHPPPLSSISPAAGRLHVTTNPAPLLYLSV